MYIKCILNIINNDKLKNAKFVRNVYISNNTFSEFYSLLINLTF